MEKLSIEEKAKRYDKLFVKASRIYNKENDVLILHTIEDLFPELKESEDERIRKELIEFVKSRGGFKQEYIAWLEKQGSQNNTEDEDLLYRFCFYSYKDESNILYLSGLYVNGECRNKGIGTKILEVADEVAKNLNCYAIRLKTKIGSNAERLYRRNGYNTLIKEGNQIWLEKQGREKPADNVESKFKVGDWITDDEDEVIFHITSYDIDYGYQLETVNGTSFHYSDETIEKKYRLWTIQDAKDGNVLTNGDFPCIFKRCDDNGSLYVYCGINAHNDFSILSEDPENVWDDYSKQYFPATKEQRDTFFAKMKESGYEWLEETKELKKIEQESAEWKQENVEELSEFENAMMHIGYSFFGKRGGLDPNDTSSVKVQAQYLLELAQKPAWSEEDENVLEDIEEAIINYWHGDTQDILLDWLNSLKQRIKGE